MCDKEFHSFYNLRDYKRKEHGAQRGSGAQYVDIAHVMRDVDDNSLKIELESCKHFLVDSEMQNGKQRVYTFPTGNLDPKCLLEKLNVVFNSLKGAVKVTLAFGFVLKNVEDGSCRYCYAHETFLLKFSVKKLVFQKHMPTLLLLKDYVD